MLSEGVTILPLSEGSMSATVAHPSTRSERSFDMLGRRKDIGKDIDMFGKRKDQGGNTASGPETPVTTGDSSGPRMYRTDSADVAGRAHARGRSAATRSGRYRRHRPARRCATFVTRRYGQQEARRWPRHRTQRRDSRVRPPDRRRQGRGDIVRQPVDRDFHERRFQGEGADRGSRDQRSLRRRTGGEPEA